MNVFYLDLFVSLVCIDNVIEKNRTSEHRTLELKILKHRTSGLRT